MTQLPQQKTYAGAIIFYTCLLSFSYAILRYHILGSVPWKDLPFFILNKAFALSAFILLTFNFSFGPLKNLGVNVSDRLLNSRKTLGMTGFLLAIIHVFMSFLIFTPAVYGKFYHEDGSLTLFAGLSMLGGILSFVVLWVLNLSFQTYLRNDPTFIKVITSRKFLLIGLLLGLIHLYFMGIDGWLEPSEWNGGLPPISLIGFSFMVVGYIINLFGRK